MGNHSVKFGTCIPKMIFFYEKKNRGSTEKFWEAHKLQKLISKDDVLEAPKY